MLDNISLIAQNAIRVVRKDGKVIYFDPFKVEEYKSDADYIFVTHEHFDHFSKDDILKIKKDDTKIIAPKDLEKEIQNLHINNYLLVDVNKEYELDDIEFKTVPAYNINKNFHKKEYNWVGYVVGIDGDIIYVAGDTDNIEEIRNIKCDIACVPVGGTYTMDAKEAAELIKVMKPCVAIPTHYQTIVGSVEDAVRFKEILNGYVDVQIIYGI